MANTPSGLTLTCDPVQLRSLVESVVLDVLRCQEEDRHALGRLAVRAYWVSGLSGLFGTEGKGVMAGLTLTPSRTENTTMSKHYVTLAGSRVRLDDLPPQIAKAVLAELAPPTKVLDRPEGDRARNAQDALQATMGPQMTSRPAQTEIARPGPSCAFRGPSMETCESVPDATLLERVCCFCQADGSIGARCGKKFS